MGSKVPAKPYDQTSAAAEQLSLATKRKLNPPSYYDSEIDRDQGISSDTEAALILISSTAKFKAVEYMKAFADAGVSAASEDYNDLLTEFSAAQVTVSENISADLAQVTGKFQAFRGSVLQAGDTNPVVSSGMTRPLQAMVASLGRLGKKETREKFHQLFNKISVQAFAKADADPLKRELRSWVRVFVSYP